MSTDKSDLIESATPVASIQVLFLGALAIIAGTVLSAVILPMWLPDLTSSLVGESPKVYWYLSRSSALVSFWLLWASMAFGLVITNRLARLWPGGPAAVDLHQYVSLLGLGFGLFHAFILLGDKFIQMSLFQILAPFASQAYRPVWVGLGQLAFYLWGVVIGSFYIRKKISAKNWRLLHYTSFLVFAMALAHGIFSGSDSHTVWAYAMYWIAAGSLLFLTYYRIMISVGAKRARQPKNHPSGASCLQKNFSDPGRQR